jgi:hypothetical protein
MGLNVELSPLIPDLYKCPPSAVPLLHQLE